MSAVATSSLPIRFFRWLAVVGHSMPTFQDVAPAVAPTRLLPGQARTIHAEEGLCLQVLSGRLWLTQPGATQDVFLTAGETLVLSQNGVVIEADLMPDAPPLTAHVDYRLLPLSLVGDAART